MPQQRPYLTCVLALACLASACEVGSLSGRGPGPGPGPSGGSVDASVGGPGADAAPVGSLPDAGAAVACDAPVTAGLPSGKHNAGRSCLGAACHAPGGDGPTFTLGGTVFTGVTSTTAVKGATIHLVDGNGSEILLVSASNGNFWSTDPISFPVQVRASSCPDSQAMGGPVPASSASCNQGGCHDGTFRIHLP